MNRTDTNRDIREPINPAQTFAVEVSLPELLRRDRAAVERSMEDVRVAAGDGVEVGRSGWTGRRAAADVAPLVVVALLIASEVMRGVAGGFLEAIGSEGVAAIKRVVSGADRTWSAGIPSEVRVEIRARVTSGDEEASHEVAISIPRGVFDNPELVVDRVLDGAFSQANQLLGRSSSEWIVYDTNSRRWVSMSERLAVHEKTEGSK
jgi:hypothetical protein